MTDYELYVDYDSDRLILEFPWQSGETDFDPEAAIEEIGSTAYLTFRKGSSADGELILDGSMVESAAAQYGPVSGSTSEYYVASSSTTRCQAFGDATTELYQSSGTISIWLDDQNVSTATVNAAITDGAAIITSSASNPFTQEDVVKMARQINSGALPFALTVDSYSTVSPSLGENSLSAWCWPDSLPMPHRGADDSAVSSARLPGLHCTGRSGGGNVGFRLRLFPGV